MKITERELSLSVLDIIEEILPQTKLGKSKKLQVVLGKCRRMLEVPNDNGN
jgi:hypothetical protein